MLIYKATNIINGKVYIGQTTKTLEERKATHKKDSKHLNTFFYRAIRKYGWDAFKWEIIHDNIASEDELDELEIYYIKKYNSFDNPLKGYNTQSGGRHFRVTNEECKKRSVRMQGSKNPMFGKPGTWLGKHFSDEHKKNLSKVLKNKPHLSTRGGNNPAAKQIINITTGEIFNCIKDACEKYQISYNSIYRNLTHKTKTCCGCVWEYYKKEQHSCIPIIGNNKNIRKPKKQIYVLELDTVFPTAIAAAKAIGCDNSLISKKCKTVKNNEYALAKNYHVRYYE